MKDFLGSIQINSLFIDGGTEMKNLETIQEYLSTCYMRCCLIYESLNKVNCIFNNNTKRGLTVQCQKGFQLELEISKTRLLDSQRPVFPVSPVELFLFCMSPGVKEMGRYSQCN